MKILGKKREKIIDKDFFEISVSELISVTGGIIAGIFLLSLIDKLSLIPGLLILLPGFLEMHGNIAGSLAGRLSTALYTKKIKPKFKKSKFLTDNILASIFLVLVVSLVLGLVAFLAVYLFSNISDIRVLYIALFAAILTIILEIPITIISTFWLFRHKYDLDDIMGPYVTTTGDIISIISLFLAAAILL